MKLVRRNDQEVVFHLTREDKKELLRVLNHYPFLPVDFQPPQRSQRTPAESMDEALIQDLLAEQKRQNKELLDKLLGLPDRFRPSNRGWHFRLETGEVEWFLQVLNDVHVGAWHQAGCPDEPWDLPVTSQNLENLWLMETSGFFICRILDALHA